MRIIFCLSMVSALLLSCSSEKYLYYENDKLKMTIDSLDWYLTIPMGSFRSQQVVVDSSFGFYNLYDSYNNIQADISIEPSKECSSSECIRDREWEKQKKHLNNASNIKVSSIGDSYTYEFTFLNRRGDQKHFYVFLYQNGFCITIHLSQTPFSESNYDKFTGFISSIEFEKKVKTTQTEK